MSRPVDARAEGQAPAEAAPETFSPVPVEPAEAPPRFRPGQPPVQEAARSAPEATATPPAPALEDSAPGRSISPAQKDPIETPREPVASPGGEAAPPAPAPTAAPVDAAPSMELPAVEPAAAQPIEPEENKPAVQPEVKPISTRRETETPGGQSEAATAEPGPPSIGGDRAATQASPTPAPAPAAAPTSMPPEVKQAVEVLSQPPAIETGPDASHDPARAAASETRSLETLGQVPDAVREALQETPPSTPSNEEGNPSPASAPAANAQKADGVVQYLQATSAPVTPDDLMPDPNDPVAKPSIAATAGTGATILSPSAGADMLRQLDQVTPAAAKSATKRQDEQVEQTACATCGGFHKTMDGPLLHGCLTCGGGNQNCIPGRKPCNPPLNECNTVVGAFFQSIYECLCCPDPCYQPTWVPAANASFFADYARPRTVTRIRYDNLEAMNRPDRNQFFLNNVNPVSNHRNNTVPIGNLYARLQQVSLYQEAAGERGSFFVEYPYRQINESWAPTQAGFGDVNFGMKSLLFDCELLQVSFQMRTYMPSGNFMLNLGRGQFVVDPSILTSMKLGPDTYFQGQFGNFTPVGGPGGNSNLAGGVFYWFMSLNQVLWYATPDSPLIATLEMDGWSFENGGYTPGIGPNKKVLNPVPSGGGVSYFNIGPGLRQSICNNIDFGGAITWATTSAHWAQPWFRFEVRFLF
jgi:hypothetical protein